MIARRRLNQRSHAVVDFANNSRAILLNSPRTTVTIRAQRLPNLMRRYRITTPLVAVRLCRSNETEKAGVMASLSADAVVEIQGPSELGDGMIEVTREHQRYAVFELDLATPLRIAAVAYRDSPRLPPM
jgi:hypothetical protein